MTEMYEGGYGIGQLNLAGHCKKCKALKIFEIDVTKGNLKEQFMCEKCYDDEFGVQAQRDKKLEFLLTNKKKWWEFWKY